MTDIQFEESSTLYELFKRTKQKANKKTIAKLGPLLGLSTNTDDLIARIDRLTKGLPVEDEFIALATWMGRCKLIHKLDQEQFLRQSRDRYQVPDLYAVFDYNGKEIPVLIDVKTSDQNPPPSAKFRLTARMHERLTNYAASVGLPLLIAWKVFGHWALFDIRAMQKHETAYHIDWSGAWSNDLMFLLLGNIMIAPMSGVRFTITYKDLGPTGRRTKGGQKHTIEYQSLHVSSTSTNKIEKMSWPQILLFMFTDQTSLREKRGELLDIYFETSEDPSAIPGYALLPLMLFWMRKPNERPKSWYDVIKNDDFGNVTYGQFKQAAESGLGVFTQYVTNMVPHKHPDFLPRRLPK